ncbi:reverse transcriptase domain-containing protein [Tanacetum coccineum]
MNKILQSSIKDRILATQKEAVDEFVGLQKGLDEIIEQRSDRTLYYLDQIWVPLKGEVRTLIMDEAHKSKFMMIQEFCPSHEMQKLESELWNHAMVGVGHAAYTDRFHELARLVPHLVTPESRMIERYMYGLSPQIYRMVASMELKTIQKAVHISGALTDRLLGMDQLRRLRKKEMWGNLARIRMLGMIIRGLGLGMLLLLL